MWNQRHLFIENSYYHIYNRGYNKTQIFHNLNDYSLFINLLMKYLYEYPEIWLVSYTVLPNHFHLIVKIIAKWNNVSNFMRKLQWIYATVFRFKYPILWKCPVFEWRFKSKLIYSEEYFLKCQAYVNYNAIKHKLVENIADWPYTSYHNISDIWKFLFFKSKLIDFSKEVIDYIDVDLDIWVDDE